MDQQKASQQNQVMITQQNLPLPQHRRHRI